MWKRETDNWIIVEFGKNPSSFRTFLAHKSGKHSLAFSYLGTSREKLEEAEDASLDLALTYLGVGALKDAWTVSDSSLWANLLRYVPEVEKSIENVLAPDMDRFKELWDLFQAKG